MKYCVVLSGGMDSTTLLWDLLDTHGEALAVSFHYGQRHSKELECAKRTTARLGVEHRIIDLLDTMGQVQAGGRSALLHQHDVPHGHYEGEQMKRTVVPNRNMIMLSLAAAVAINEGCEGIAYAAHFGDHAIYPDCRKDFANAMKWAIGLCDWWENATQPNAERLLAPYAEIMKDDIAKIGDRLGVAYEDTWSCYEGGDVHCGQCGTCVERREAFMLAGVEDPVEYAVPWEVTEGLLQKSA